jgi:hypothetical protein
MANIDDLRLLDEAIRLAERRAVEGLAAHLREAIRDLPSESRLGLVFLRCSDQLDEAAAGQTPAPIMGVECVLERVLESLEDEVWLDEAGGC